MKVPAHVKAMAIEIRDVEANRVDNLAVLADWCEETEGLMPYARFLRPEPDRAWIPKTDHDEAREAIIKMLAKAPTSNPS